MESTKIVSTVYKPASRTYSPIWTIPSSWKRATRKTYDEGYVGIDISFPCLLHSRVATLKPFECFWVVVASRT